MESLKNLIKNLEFHILKQEDLFKEYEAYTIPPRQLLIRMQENSNKIENIKSELSKFDK